MKTRLHVFSRVLAGELTADAAAAQLHLDVAAVQRGVEALEMAHVLLAHDRKTRRKRLAVLGLIAAVVGTGWATTPAWAQSCTQTLPSPLVTFCPNDPAVAAQVNGNFQQLITWLTTKTGTLSSQDITTRDVTLRNVTSSGAINFGTTGGQMLNLYTAGYGIGIQNSTLYTRSSGNFGWYLGGTNVGGNVLDPGPGGTLQMSLTTAGDLTVPANVWSGASSDSSEVTASSNGALNFSTCGNGRFVCGVGIGHNGGDNNYWTGVRLAVRCCPL